jgi:hypothetical protein
MKRHLTPRFYVEVLVALMNAVLVTVTLVRRDWIELVFGVDPDQHNGSLEVSIVVLFAAATVALSLLARWEWRTASHRQGLSDTAVIPWKR